MFTLAALLSATLSLAPAHAADAIGLEVVKKGQLGQSNPALIVIPRVGVSDMNLRLDCGGAWVEHKGGAKAGQRIKLEFQPQAGSHQCTGKLSATFSDGSTGQMPLSFGVEMLPALGISVNKETLDTNARTMQVTLDRPAGQIEVTVYGIGGAELGTGMVPAQGTPAGTPITVQWSASPGEVLKMQVKGTDADGFWSMLELKPWYYDIPHEDVVFETAKTVIRDGEVPKLKAAMAEVDKVLAKYGSEATINLYVGGYTDTVGDKTMNLALSAQRATAIALWFEQAGFSQPIHVQGFGERGLAVRTGDETDEARNRRAVYILAAEAPPTSPQLPSSAWKPLR